jgi:ABC-type uncharacterized transport system ATPase subunit
MVDYALNEFSLTIQRKYLRLLGPNGAEKHHYPDINKLHLQMNWEIILDGEKLRTQTHSIILAILLKVVY